jgi:RNA polymerase sigma factor (sigma-70 family)
MPAQSDLPDTQHLPRNVPATEGAGGHQFCTTHWSEVLAAGDPSSPRSADALERLCRAYWYPLYAYVRRSGHGTEDAQDLVQEFFARFLGRSYLRRADRNRGRFRTFLLTSLKHFLVNDWIRGNREKRGGGRQLLSFDEAIAESRLAAEPATDQAPDTLYDRGWASVLLERAMEALKAEMERSGKRDLLDRLKEFVWGESSGMPYAVMAEKLGMTEGAVKVAVHRLRQRYGELLRAEIEQTMSEPAEVEEELRYLITVLRESSSALSQPAAKPASPG